MDTGTDMRKMEKEKQAAEVIPQMGDRLAEEAAVLCRPSGRVLINTQDEANQRGTRGGVFSGEWGMRPRYHWIISEKG